MGRKTLAMVWLIFVAVACGNDETGNDGPLAALVRETPISGPFTEFDIGDAVELIPGVDLIIDDVSWQLSISRFFPNPLFSAGSLDQLGRKQPAEQTRVSRSPRGDGDWYMIVAYTVVNGSRESIDPSPLPGLIYVMDDEGRRVDARHFNPDAPLPVYGEEDHLFDTPTLGALAPGRSGSGLLVFEAQAASDLNFLSDIVGFTMDLPAHLSPEFLGSIKK